MSLSEIWMSKVNGVLKEHGGLRQDGKVASERTQEATKEVVYASIRLLHAMGYALQDPKNLSEKHIQSLVRRWWFEDKRAPKTIENNLSRLRRFSEMMGKVGMVKKATVYLPDVPAKELVVSAVATSSKSWAAQELDMAEWWPKIDSFCPRLGAILRMELAFGLRRAEALKCRPHTQGYIGLYAVLPGQGKGGRYRNVITMTPAQGMILEQVKKIVPRGESMGWTYTKGGKHASLAQNKSRYNKAMGSLGFTKAELGVTGHGLRAQFAENNALAHGILPPSMGGTKGQMEKGAMKVLLERLSEDMGHHRDRVMSSYYMAFSRSTAPDAADRSIINIRSCLHLLPQIDLLTIPDAHRTDSQYIRGMLEAFDLELTLRQVHALWSLHSRRNGVEWMKPEREIALGMEAQALGLMGKHKTPEKKSSRVKGAINANA